jgi:tetrahydromethanopterin S-methyltransferase subunit F
MSRDIIIGLALGLALAIVLVASLHIITLAVAS